ncbi:MAG: NAD-dependent epimerase/dehydratase family protein [Deltaproteobacteria bacterium]|nr:NAD-dependent epimerase/dehydratase family protein [Deltaproteobacteria bacterium]
MKVAVTGASGFIGRYVLDQLVQQNVNTIAVTRKAARLSDWADRVEIVEMDIACPPPDGFNRIARPDVLIHLAWDGLPNYQSLHHFETELPRQYGFLKAMIEAGLPSLLVTGTCFEYGMQSGPLSEDRPTRPETSYGYAKDALRRQLEFLQKTRPFALQWVRLFYLYGRGQSKTSLYPLLKDAVAQGCRTFDMSGGEQLRDYLPVEDAARLIVRVAIHCTVSELLNICAGKPVSIRKLVQQWVAENGWQIELNLGYYPYPDHEPMAFWGDRRRLDRLLDALSE